MLISANLFDKTRFLLSRLTTSIIQKLDQLYYQSVISFIILLQEVVKYNVMLIYIQLVLALVTQQTLLSHIAIFQALENFVPWYQIHTIAFFVTIFDLVVPYWLGRYIVSNTKHERFVNIVERFKSKLNLVNRTNKYLILFIFGIFNYIYVNTFLIAFLGVNPKKALVATFFGDLVWYLFLISSTLAGINILRDIQTFSIAILLTIIFAIVGEELLRRSKNS